MEDSKNSDMKLVHEKVVPRSKFAFYLKVVLAVIVSAGLTLLILVVGIPNNIGSKNRDNPCLKSHLFESKKSHIQSSFKEAWYKFLNSSRGADEINSITGEPKTTWGGWGTTLIDSLDTLYIMNLTEEFESATEAVSHVDFTKGDITTAFFEVAIRNLGGLISAYDLSGKEVLLNKAKALADVLLKDFDSPSGLPYRDFDFKSQTPIKDSKISLASVGTCQLELVRLSMLTGDKKYGEIALSIYEKLDKAKSKPGWFNSHLDINTGKFNTKEVSFGADADSFYEYLLKVPILTGSKDKDNDNVLKMFYDSMDMMQSDIIQPCYGGKICFGRINANGSFVASTHHLEFFIPGLLMLGGNYTNNQTLTDKGLQLLDSFLDIPKLASTGLAPEEITFSKDQPMVITHKKNSLRPELVESLFYAYRFTHQQRYRDETWDLFQAFETYSCVNYGYSDYTDVTNTDAKSQTKGDMPSFFFAETFKYIYMTFCDDTVIPLNDWVLNTEAHPFRIPK